MAKRSSRQAARAGIRTLAVDIGASGIKALIMDESGRPLTVHDRIKTPFPSTPVAVLRVIRRLAKKQGRFDRVAVGFPGVVRNGSIETESNLDRKWRGFRLAEKLEAKLGKPVRVANDADMHGFGAISGRGVELVITLGTGFGSALFLNGNLVPNLEIALYPQDGKNYGQRLGNAARKKVGNRKWNIRLSHAIDALLRVFNYDHLYIGGGNSKKVTLKLPPGVTIVPNVTGLLGGIELWRE